MEEARSSILFGSTVPVSEAIYVFVGEWRRNHPVVGLVAAVLAIMAFYIEFVLDGTYVAARERSSSFVLGRSPLVERV